MRQNAIARKSLNRNQLNELASLYDRMEDILGGFDQGLSLENRRRLIHLDRENLLFIRDVANTLQKKPSLCPGYLNAEEIIDEYNFYRQLEELILLHKHAQENLRDIQIILGDGCFRNGLSVYRSVADAKDNGVPGAKVFFQQLNKRFRTRRNSGNNGPVVTPIDEPTIENEVEDGSEDNATPMAEAA